ncbi:MAG: trypsin-like peptidase domain-containing protein [Methylotenera sp.]|nr:trypsin-like peptidase domain-containing protein [Methylotenera sp.]
MKNLIALFLLAQASQVIAQPSIGELLSLHHSIVQISVELGNGTVGTGTGVVVSPEYVVTNCHVLANGKGANVAKYNDGYKPIALKADWKHDLCALKFEGLPFKPVNLRDSASLAIEEDVFSLGYPNGNNVPQPSYGSIKAKYAMDGSLIIRSNTAFSLGSSGGALFDKKLNLIGMTTFKSPGPQGFYYSLPVEWIRALIASKELLSLNTDESPFWALPFDQQPYFMQVVIPYQNKDWPTLHAIAEAWTKSQPEAPDAWYYLGVADHGLNRAPLAKNELNKALSLNPQHLEVFMQQSKIALQEADFDALEKLTQRINSLDPYAAELLASNIVALKQSKALPPSK